VAWFKTLPTALSLPRGGSPLNTFLQVFSGGCDVSELAVIAERARHAA
jgi:hypothetical protein